MRKQSIDQASGQQKKMEQIIRRVIRTRRQEEGFDQNIPPECWEATEVRKAMTSAAKYLKEQCCEAEVEALADEPNPEDIVLESALENVQKALNGLMVFTKLDPEPQSKRPESKHPASPDSALAECFTKRQVACENTAMDYFHWLLAGDEWVLRVRDGLPPGLSERQMLDLLLCPVRRVLSLDDYAALGLNPWLTTGRIVSEQEVLALRQEIPHPRAIFLNTTPGDGTEEDRTEEDRTEEDGEEEGGEEEGKTVELTREITVELNRLDGTQVNYTVQRQGTHDYTCYQVQGLDLWWKNVSRFASEAAIESIWEQFCGDKPADKKKYPRFPHVFFGWDRASVSGEIEALCQTMRENDFYTDTHAALRYLMMGVEARLIGFRCSQDSPYYSDTQEFIRGRYYMTIPAWSLPEEVAEYWRQVRPQTARERCLPTEEHLTLFSFVLQHTAAGTEPRWAELARLWQQEQGQVLTRDRLYRTFSRVRVALFPPYEHTLKQKAVGIQNIEDAADAADEGWQNGANG